MVKFLPNEIQTASSVGVASFQGAFKSAGVDDEEPAGGVVSLSLELFGDTLVSSIRSPVNPL